MEHQVVTETGERQADVKKERSPQRIAVPSPQSHPLHQFQQTLGNRAFGQFIQAKLKISQPTDEYEQEADRAAEQVMRMPDPAHSETSDRPELSTTAATAHLQRTCNRCQEVIKDCCGDPSEKEDLHLRAKAVPGQTPTTDSQTGGQIKVVRGGGEPLGEQERAYFEPRFGHDFSQVRVHRDSRAAESAQSVNALAYTLGSDVVFGAEQYAPGTMAGRRLLAHELAHVVQQNALKQAGNESGVLHRQRGHGRCNGVSLRLPNTITFNGDRGPVEASVSTNITPGDYTIRYETGTGQFSISPWPTADIILNVSLSNAPRDRIDAYRAYRDSLAGTGAPLHVAQAGVEGESAGAGQVIGSIPVTFSATEVVLPGALTPQSLLAAGTPPSAAAQTPGLIQHTVPSLPGRTMTDLGLASNFLAWGDMSWLSRRNAARMVASVDYWRPMIPTGPGQLTLDRLVNSVERSRLGPRIESEIAEMAAGTRQAYTWSTEPTRTFRPDPLSPLTRNFTEAELLNIPELVRRLSTNPNAPLSVLTPQELQLLREAARLHIDASSAGSPLVSYMSQNFPLESVGQKRFRIRVEFPRSAALDVSGPNPFNEMGALDRIENAIESEFSVTANQNGRIVAVERAPNVEPGFLMRHAGAIRWAGRILLVAGVGVSAYRIASAPQEQRSVVVGEEIGGQVFGAIGMVGAAAGCLALGVATGGIGLFLCGLGGGILLGAAGSYVGGEVARSMQGRRGGASSEIICPSCHSGSAVAEGRESATRMSSLAQVMPTRLTADEVTLLRQWLSSQPQPRQ
jgi:Domain of unknown function (DUF4157)